MNLNFRGIVTLLGRISSVNLGVLHSLVDWLLILVVLLTRDIKPNARIQRERAELPSKPRLRL